MPNAIVWGVEASPFLLKLEAMLRYSERPFRRLPGAGSLAENLRTVFRLERAKRNRRVSKYPVMDGELDEYPSVPFFSEDGENFFYDTSALAHWLDDRPGRETPSLFPKEAKLQFLASLIDEAFDEFGLYMVHHMRWVGSIGDTKMGESTAAEMSKLMTPILAPIIQRRLPHRQVRRCPYLFSVAPFGYQGEVEADPNVRVEAARIPPTKSGFPPTHDLLKESWHGYLAAMECVLSQQPFLLGDRFTVADASAYGQLSMNLIDPSAVREMRQVAPRTHAWLEEIRDGKHVGTRGALYLSEAVNPLLSIIMETFAEIMVQNESAYLASEKRGETIFNEEAFDQGKALYDGQVRGKQFRSVVKTFQVRVWRDLRASWSRLSDAERSELCRHIPRLQGIESDDG